MINEDLYRKCLEAAAAKEVKRMQQHTGTNGVWYTKERKKQRVRLDSEETQPEPKE